MRAFLPGFTSFKAGSSNFFIGDQGKPVLFYGAWVNAGAGGTSTVSILNGNGAGSPVAFKLSSVAANTVNNINLPMPVMLPAGGVVLFDANAQSVGVQYVQMA